MGQRRRGPAGWASMRLGAPLVLLLLAVLAPSLAGADESAPTVGERVLLDNDRVTVIELVFPPGFQGEEHAAVADEFAYVLSGEFAVVTRGRGKRVVRPGEVEYAPKGTIHRSLNETTRPARVLVVILKEP